MSFSLTWTTRSVTTSSSGEPAWVGPARGGAGLAVWAVPGAAHSEIVGHTGDYLRVRLSAPPVEGRANKELVRFLAERLGVRQADVRIASGASGRRKRVVVDGLTPADVAQRLGSP
jgi:uncharacterized protein (TIGR00251 family)